MESADYEMGGQYLGESFIQKRSVDLRILQVRYCISVAIDGSEDKDISISGLEDYTVEMSNSDSTSNGEATNEPLQTPPRHKLIYTNHIMTGVQKVATCITD